MDRFLNPGKEAISYDVFAKEIKADAETKWKPVFKKALMTPKISDFFPSDKAEEKNIFGKKINGILYPIKPNMIFRAYNTIKSPENVKVVMFGQDPYPRRDSAIGLSFCDGECKNWNLAIPPSLRNLIKCILISRKAAAVDTQLSDVRRYLMKIKLPQIQEWFEKLNSPEYGVMWLNTSLTFTGKEETELAKNLQFWRPVMDETISTIAKNADNVVWVLMGGKAQGLAKTIRAAYGKAEKHKFQIVASAHPAYDAPFYKTIVFDDIYIAQKKLGITPTDWLLGCGEKLE